MSRRELPPGIGAPVQLASDLAAVDHPQWLPPSPHNLPPNRDRLPVRQFQSGVGLLESAAPVVPTSPGPAADATITDPHHYATLQEGNFTPPLTFSSSDQLFLPQSAARRNLLMIRNVGATNISIGFGNVATAQSALVLAAGAIIIFDAVVPQNDLYAWSDAAAGQISYAYGTVN